MIADWMVYAMLLGGYSGVAALALEPVLVSRRMPRRLAWGAALAAAAVLPVLVALRPVALAPESAGSEELPTMAAGGPVMAPLAGGWSVDQGLLLAWGLVSLTIVAIIAASAFQLHRAGLRSRETVVDGEAVALTDDLGPGARCFGSPRIVIPQWLLSIDAVRRELLVRHEREHVRAGDPYLLVASLAALAAMPWNPALWFIARRLRSALELDCDARVLAGGGNVAEYGELLLTVAASRRAPRLAAYLAFASSPSPLERRIRAMTTSRPSLGTLRQLSLGSVVLAAAIAACEARRPEPLAPVTSYVVADGRATASTAPTGAQADTIRGRLSNEVHMRVPAPTLSGNANDPLVIVYDAEGKVVLTGRLGAKTGNGAPALDSIPFPAEAIASVDVIKSGALLPPEAKGGLIRVVLKPELTLPRKGASSAPESVELLRLRQAATPTTEEMLVIVSDANGRELLRKTLTSAGPDAADAALQALPIDVESIARVDVSKVPAGAPSTAPSTIRVTLKAGAGLQRARQERRESR